MTATFESENGLAHRQGLAVSTSRDPKWTWGLASAVIVCLILIGWALRATMIVTMPLTFSFFVAVMLAPIVHVVVKHRALRHRPRLAKGLGVALAMLVYLVITAVFIAVFVLVGRAILTKLSENSEKIQSAVQSAQQYLEREGIGNSEENMSLSSLADRATSTIRMLVQSVTAIVAFLVTVFFFTLLMLMEESQWRKKLVRLVGQRGVHLNRRVGPSVRRYLKIRTVLGFISAILSGAWLTIMGVDDAWVWAAVVFLMNYIPSIGSILSSIPPILMSLSQQGVTRAIVVAVGLLIIEQFMGNFLDPLLQGKGSSISPVAMLLFVLLWGWIWGIAGLFIGVPICLVVYSICSEFEVTKPFHILLHDKASDSRGKRRKGRYALLP